MNRTCAAAMMLALACGAAAAQTDNLYSPASNDTGGPATGLTIERMSLTYVPPPEPREFRKHDLVTIIIDENSSATASQTLDTKKNSDTAVDLNSILDPWQLLELRLRGGDTSNLTLIDAEGDRNYKGEGDYERKDKMSARITAEIIDVKPNGTLVLQASKRIAKDEEVQMLVLTGVIRLEDVTTQNTVLSSQIASMDLKMTNEGEVRKTAKKGFLTRMLDAIFAF